MIRIRSCLPAAENKGGCCLLVANNKEGMRGIMISGKSLIFKPLNLNVMAWLNQMRKGSFGWVARDFAGAFKAAGGVGNVYCESSLMAEAEAVRAALVGMLGEGIWVCSN